MKKIFILAILTVFACFRSMGQHSAGSVSVGGTFNLSVTSEEDKNNNTTTDGPTRTNFSVIPSIEYFFMQNVSAGVGIGYSTSVVKEDLYQSTYKDYKYKTPRFVLNPYARLYKSLGDKVSLFGEASVDLSLGKNKESYSTTNTTTTTSYKANYFSIGIAPGIQYSISSKIALEATFGFLGYTVSSVDTQPNASTKTKDFTLNLDPTTLYFGFRYYIK